MNNELWHADIPITDELVKECLHHQFPLLAPIKKIQCIGEGWDNKVFLINEKIIFRFPRRKIAVELIERENKILKNLYPIAAIDIPNPKYIGQPSSCYPYPFQGYDIIKGVSGCHAQLSTQARIASLRTLAIFLKQLHSVNETQALSLGAKPSMFDRTNIKKAVNELTERVDKIIARKLCIINEHNFQQEITMAQKVELPTDKCLIHGDLYCKHLLFNENKLTAIIDWGDVGINNRSVDLSVIWSFYPNSCHQQFFEIYGAVDSATWQYARFLGLYSSLTLILYGHATNDILLIEESTNAVKRINADLVQGSVGLR